MSPNTFFDQFAEKRQGEEISNFLQKVYYQSFCSVEKFFSSKNYANTFFYLFSFAEKRQRGEILNF